MNLHPSVVTAQASGLPAHAIAASKPTVHALELESPAAIGSVDETCSRTPRESGPKSRVRRRITARV